MSAGVTLVILHHGTTEHCMAAHTEATVPELLSEHQHIYPFIMRAADTYCKKGEYQISNTLKQTALFPCFTLFTVICYHSCCLFPCAAHTLPPANTSDNFKLD